MVDVVGLLSRGSSQYGGILRPFGRHDRPCPRSRPPGRRSRRPRRRTPPPRRPTSPRARQRPRRARRPPWRLAGRRGEFLLRGGRCRVVVAGWRHIVSFGDRAPRFVASCSVTEVLLGREVTEAELVDLRGVGRLVVVRRGRTTGGLAAGQLLGDRRVDAQAGVEPGLVDAGGTGVRSDERARTGERPAVVDVVNVSSRGGRGSRGSRRSRGGGGSRRSRGSSGSRSRLGGGLSRSRRRGRRRSRSRGLGNSTIRVSLRPEVRRQPRRRALARSRPAERVHVRRRRRSLGVELGGLPRDVAGDLVQPGDLGQDPVATLRQPLGLPGDDRPRPLSLVGRAGQLGLGAGTRGGQHLLGLAAGAGQRALGRLLRLRADLAGLLGRLGHPALGRLGGLLHLGGQVLGVGGDLLVLVGQLLGLLLPLVGQPGAQGGRLALDRGPDLLRLVQRAVLQRAGLRLGGQRQLLGLAPGGLQHLGGLGLRGTAQLGRVALGGTAHAVGLVQRDGPDVLGLPLAGGRAARRPPWRRWSAARRPRGEPPRAPRPPGPGRAAGSARPGHRGRRTTGWRWPRAGAGSRRAPAAAARTLPCNWSARCRTSTSCISSART